MTIRSHNINICDYGQSTTHIISVKFQKYQQIPVLMFGTVGRVCNASNACEWFLLIEPSHPCTFYRDRDMMRGAVHLPPSPLGPRVVGARVHLLNSCPSVTLQFSRLSLSAEPQNHMIMLQRIKISIQKSSTITTIHYKSIQPQNSRRGSVYSLDILL